MIAADFHELSPPENEAPELEEGRRAFEALLKEALARHASDLYLLADRDHTTISIRRWGLVEPLQQVPARVGRQMINVAKNYAGMDLVERRRPLDGRISLCYEGRDVDLRVSTLPTLFGEDATLRLLDPDNEVRTLDDLGLGTRDKHGVLHLLDRPSGLILVTGPTGAGKTTTLYACLAHLNDGRRKINTLEEPVEYSVPGLRQSQVNRAIGLDFAQLLASVLRQAPDVVMIGEVRDAETAATAVRAANSGHLVFATLHAPVAAAAIPSMLALGAAPHFLASSLVGVVSQRLVRRLCPRCRVAYELPGAAVFDEVAHLVEGDADSVIYGPKGCHACDDSGYTGRSAVVELLHASRRVRELVAATRPADEIHAQACEEGMVSFRQASLVALAEGRTSIDEVTRVVPGQVLGLEE